VALTELRGHHEAREALLRLSRQGSFPQSLLLHGPPGVGKERLGLWVAQLLLCEDAAAGPCGTCASCRLVLRLEHPDAHWFFPLPRPEGATPEKLRDRLEEARAAELQLHRKDPLRIIRHEKPPAYFLAAIRTVQHLASMRPSIGRRKVFVVGDAEMMVPQESSPEAANAFLKLLEEPPEGTTLVLTSSNPGGLLPTIRSRVLALRVGALLEPEIESLLTEAGVDDPERARSLARRARGSAERALRMAREDAGPGTPAEGAAGKALLLAALARDGVPRFGAAMARKVTGAKHDFVSDLDSFSEWLRDLMAVAAGAESHVLDSETSKLLRRAVEQRNVAPEGVMRSIERVAAARDLALGNVNPQLILVNLLRDVQRDLVDSRSPAGAIIE
jgi:DNA polymerase III subunit delta'